MKNNTGESLQQKRALVLAFDGIEEVEALAPVDVLRRAGVETTMASLSGSKSLTGRNRISFEADVFFENIEKESFDLLFLPGGPGVLELVEDERVRQLILSFDHILTSQGTGTAIDFGLELARLLTGDESARSVPESIHSL